MENSDRKTSLWAVVFAWMVAAIPLGWGVYQSLVNSLPLFRVSSMANPGRPDDHK